METYLGLVAQVHDLKQCLHEKFLGFPSVFTESFMFIKQQDKPWSKPVTDTISLQRVAESSSETEFEENLSNLRQSPQWVGHAALQRYVENEWLSQERYKVLLK